MTGSLRARARDLPMFWKLLLPFLGLILVIGASGTFLIVRDLSNRAHEQLDRDLTQRLIDARTVMHDHELYLLESVNFASNLQGMAAAIDARDADATTTLLASVAALKRDLDLLTVTDATGAAVTGIAPDGAGWRALIEDALDEPEAARTSGLITGWDEPMVAVAGAVCRSWNPCDPSGVAVAGLSLTRLATALRARDGAQGGITIFDLDGRPLALAGPRAPAPAPLDGSGTSVVRDHGDDAILYTTYRLGGRRAGTLAVTTPRSAAFASVRGAGLRVGGLLLAAMAGIVALGALLSRFILAQVRPLLATSRALGRGDRSARAPVIADDELGELARGLNEMAEQLQASYETLESRVEQRTEEVRRLLAERTEFFASMSHELRTPLAVILSEADLLADAVRPMPAREARQTGGTIRASSDQLLAVINEVLELARADAGRIEVELAPLRLSDVIKDLRPTLDGLARANGITLNTSVPKDLPQVVGDRRRMREVLLNLVDNAIKYTPEGGSVTIEAEASSDMVELRVADTGVGIPPETGDRIFEPFFRVTGIRPLRGQSSTGLGLALAKGFVEAQGGTLTFTSTPGTGTTFSCALAKAVARQRVRRPA